MSPINTFYDKNAGKQITFYNHRAERDLQGHQPPVQCGIQENVSTEINSKPL